LHEHVGGHTESPYPEQEQGPHERPVRPGEDLDVNGQWHQFFIDALCDAADVQDLEQRFYSHLQEQAISWTSLRRTLIFFKDTLMEEDANLIGFDFDGVQALLETLCRSDHWEFLQVLSPALVRNDLEELTEECHDIEAHLEQQDVEIVSRVFRKHSDAARFVWTTKIGRCAILLRSVGSTADRVYLARCLGRHRCGQGEGQCNGPEDMGSLDCCDPTTRNRLFWRGLLARLGHVPALLLRLTRIAINHE